MNGNQRSRFSRFDQNDDVVVLKFGGTSVQDAAAIRRVIGIVRSRMNMTLQPVVVVSALARVTDQLLAAGHAAAGGHLGSALATARDIYVRHERLADELADGDPDGTLDRALRCEFKDLESLLHELASSRQFDLRAQDHLLGFGERFSSKLITAAFAASGVHAVHIDAQKCIVTDTRHGQASPLWDETNQRLQNALTSGFEAGQVSVLGGFIASTRDGVPTTLGRGGSDYTAAIVGAAICAGRIEIWTDVDGVMTTDPKLFPEARVIRKMSFEEAAELAYYGAKVLHPATLAPAMRANIPVNVLNSLKPEGEGTEITARARTGYAVSAITAKRNVASVEIASLQGVDSEVLRAVLTACDQYACPVDALGSSLGRVSLLVGSPGALPGIAADLQGIADVRWENHKALVCLVGENIRHQPHLASRAFAAVSDLDVRVVSQGASDRTISFLVEESKVEESVRRLQEPVPDWGEATAAFCQAR